jgi:hypothetical protein
MSYSVFFIFDPKHILECDLQPAEEMSMLTQADRVSKYKHQQIKEKHNSMQCGFHFKQIALLTMHKSRFFAQCKAMTHRASQHLPCTHTAFMKNIPEIELSCCFINKIRHIYASHQAC